MAAVTSLASRRPQVQIVISDGLNANALNENLRAVLHLVPHALELLGGKTEHD